MKKIIFSIIIIFLLLLTGCNKQTTEVINSDNSTSDNSQPEINKNNTTSDSMYKVGILQMVVDLDNAVQGFKDGMEELGFIESENIEYEYKNANAVSDKIIEYGEYFVNNDFDLIFCCSTPVTKALKNITEQLNKPIPIIFFREALTT